MMRMARYLLTMCLIMVCCSAFGQRRDARDRALDRYETVCDRLIELRDALRRGETISSQEVSSLQAEVRSIRSNLQRSPEGLTEEQIIPVKADADRLPFEQEFFDAVVSTDSYNYFGRDPEYLDSKLLPFVKPGGYLYITVPGMKRDCHDNLPPELLLSWTPEQLDYLHDVSYWKSIVEQCGGAEVLEVSEMESNDEVWADWLKQENEYAVGDRKAMEVGGGKYLNFIKIVLRKRG